MRAGQPVLPGPQCHFAVKAASGGCRAPGQASLLLPGEWAEANYRVRQEPPESGRAPSVLQGRGGRGEQALTPVFDQGRVGTRAVFAVARVDHHPDLAQLVAVLPHFFRVKRDVQADTSAKAVPIPFKRTIGQPVFDETHFVVHVADVAATAVARHFR